jgi:hypothetical protein
MITAMLYHHLGQPFWQRHPWMTVAGALLLGWQLAIGSYPVVFAAAVIGLVILISRRRRATALRDAGLRARADYEYRLSLAGDPRGVFGRYPPVQPGWFADPQNRYQLRYFDGAMWTGHTVLR